ncbi:MAG TPA: DUF1501 domain-containing protein [Methylomirabilota bacterium]|nr:DUF1501 domain-containing protein [Methylomirabilota bacterium]
MSVPTLARRVLLKGGACALLAGTLPPRFLARAAAAADAHKKVLVAVFQRGAVDGLSMVVPHGDGAYSALRTATALRPPRRADPASAIDLDGFFALHPGLAPLTPLWQSRALAIVHACGSPDTTRSHFDAQDYMESGTPGVKSTPDGWLARAASGLPAPGSPFRAVALGPTVPRSLRGDAGAISLASLERFGVRATTEAAVAHDRSRQPSRSGQPRLEARDQPSLQTGFESLYEQGVRDLLHGTGRETFEAVKMLERTRAAQLAPANGAEYGRSKFGQSMRQVAQLVRADVGLEVAFVDIGGWDTHVAQGAEQGQLANRLRELADGLAAFAQDLGDHLSDVVVLTMSEFGRTVAENGNRGTDHGHATAMMVLGGGVRGGKVYGRWPGLARERLFDGRDLAVTTDFRALFSEVAGRHLGIARPAALFPGWHGGPGPGVMA